MLAAAPAQLATGSAGSTRGKWRRWLSENRRHGIWIIVWSIVGWTGTILTPFLLEHPMVLMLLSPRAIFAAMAADDTNLLLFVLAGTIRLGVTDASYFIMGKRMPIHEPQPRPSVVVTGWRRLRANVVGIGDRMCSALCRRGLVAGSVLFVRPNGKLLAVAGAYGVSATTAALASIIGTMTYLGAVHMGASALF